MAKLRCITSEKNSPRITSLEKNGFQCDRYFCDLARSLTLTLQTPQFPPGFSLHKLKAAGMDTAKLGVDTENPSQALKLYESVGFTPTRRMIAYVKEVRLVS